MQKLTNELSNYREIFLKELHKNILAFWMKFGIEKEGHGFYGAADLKGNPISYAQISGQI